MTSVRVYDPAVCCSTGVCSPDADATIAQFTAALDKAKKAGISVDRFTLAHQPAEYVSNDIVKGLLDQEGVECLPIVFVDNEVISKGDYPARDVLFAKLGIPDSTDAVSAASACCGSAEKTSGCC